MCQHENNGLHLTEELTFLSCITRVWGSLLHL